METFLIAILILAIWIVGKFLIERNRTQNALKEQGGMLHYYKPMLDELENDFDFELLEKSVDGFEMIVNNSGYRTSVRLIKNIRGGIIVEANDRFNKPIRRTLKTENQHALAQGLKEIINML